MPVKAAVTPPAGQNIPLPGEGVEPAEAVNSVQTTPVKPFNKAAKGIKSDTQYVKVNRSFWFKDFLTDSFLPKTTKFGKFSCVSICAKC